MPSTRDLSRLPSIDDLRRLMQSLAVLDAIQCPDWQFRYFSFNSRWSKGEQMGSMRNGQGDHYFALFNSAGCWLKGFDHESPTAADQTTGASPDNIIFNELPAAFLPCLAEPAFLIEETTFCVWRSQSDSHWRHGPIPARILDLDGLTRLLRHLDADARTYVEWAKDYFEHFEREIPLESVLAVYAHEPLDDSLVSALNDEMKLKDLLDDLNEIGYPSRK